MENIIILLQGLKLEIAINQYENLKKYFALTDDRDNTHDRRISKNIHLFLELFKMDEWYGIRLSGLTEIGPEESGQVERLIEKMIITEGY